MKKLLFIILLFIPFNIFSQSYLITSLEYTKLYSDYSIVNRYIQINIDCSINNDSIIDLLGLQYKVINYWEENNIVYYDLMCDKKYCNATLSKVSGKFYKFLLTYSDSSYEFYMKLKK